jgi:hypothetical protein
VIFQIVSIAEDIEKYPHATLCLSTPLGRISPMSVRSTSTSGSLAIAVALLSTLPITASQAYTSEQQQLCTGDALRLCSSEIPDVDRITACMARQRAALSEGCRAVFRAEPASPATNVSYSGASKASGRAMQRAAPNAGD